MNNDRDRVRKALAEHQEQQAQIALVNADCWS